MTPTATPLPYRVGDIFASVGGGQVNRYDAGGHLLAILDTGSHSSEEKGMCSDAAGNLYVTNFDAGTMSKFDSRGRLVASPWGGPFITEPESCVVDAAGHVYVGEVHGRNRLLKFDSAGRLLATFKPAAEHMGVDWIDLAADQCTLYYTSEGGSVKRFDVCRNRQLPDLATDLAGQCYGLRIRANGDVLVACSGLIYRLDIAGRTIQTYAAHRIGEKSALVAISLDPNGKSFWTAGFETGHVYRIDLASGRMLTSFTAPPYQLLGGLAIVGEATAAQLAAAARPGACRVHTSGLPLSVQVAPRQPLSGGTVTFVVHATPHAWIDVSLQVRMIRTVVTVGGKHRKQVAQTIVLYPTGSRHIADAQGQLKGSVRISYKTTKPVQAILVVTVRAACATLTHTTSLTILPPSPHI